jgi:hypothetical protein
LIRAVTHLPNNERAPPAPPPFFWHDQDHMPPHIDEDDRGAFFDEAIIGAYELLDAEHQEEHEALIRGKHCTTYT